MKKKEATGAVSYVMLFTMALLMVIITFYLLSVAKLMSIQHDVDDALADAVLDRKSTRLTSHPTTSRMPSSA